MIHLFVWPIVVIALVQRNDIFKRIGIAIGIIASIAAVAVGVNTWPPTTYSDLFLLDRYLANSFVYSLGYQKA